MTKGKKIAALSIIGGGSAAATIGSLASQSGQGREEDDYYSEELEEDVSEEVTPVQEDVQTPPQSSPAISIPVSDSFSNTINPLLKTGITSIDYTYKTPTTPPEVTKNTDGIQNVLGEWNSTDHQYVKSSLQITSKKWNYQDNTWRGELTWFWSVSNTRTNRGFVTYNKLETTQDKKLRLTGVFYLLKRENNNAPNWTIEWRKEVTKDDKKELDAQNFGEYFPKPYWWSHEGQFHERWYDNWKFMDGVGDLNTICGDAEQECSGKAKTPTTPTVWTGKYEWSSSPWYSWRCDSWMSAWDGGKYCDYIYQWSENYNHDDGIPWWNYMYKNSGDNSKDYDIRDWLDSFYRGAWKKLPD